MLLCRHGTAVWLILAEGPCDGEIDAEIPLDPLKNRTGDRWHAHAVDGLPPEFCYGYRVDGPKDNGHRYDTHFILHRPVFEGVIVRAAVGAFRATCRAAA